MLALRKTVARVEVVLARERALREAAERRAADFHQESVDARYDRDQAISQAAGAASELNEIKNAPPIDYMEQMLRRRVIVHLKSDHSLEGFLVGAYDEHVVLDRAHYHGFMSTGDQFTEPLEGEQIISRTEIAWVQDANTVPALPGSDKA